MGSSLNYFNFYVVPKPITDLEFIEVIPDSIDVFYEFLAFNFNLVDYLKLTEGEAWERVSKATGSGMGYSITPGAINLGASLILFSGDKF